MPTKKSPPSAPKVMDIARASSVKADATGVPLIVTNRPILRDPMMADDTASTKVTEADKSKPKAKPIIRKIELQPLESDEKAEIAAATPPAESPTADGPKATDTPDDAPKTVEPAESTPQATAPKVAPAAETAGKDAAAASAKEPAPTDAAKPIEPTAAASMPAADTPESAQAPEADKSEQPPTAADEADKPTETIPGNGPDDLLADAKPADAQAVKAAREAAEKQLALDKLIAEGTYVLPVNTVEKRRLERTVLLVLLIVLVLAIAGFILALDAGYVHIAGLSAPTDFIKS